jgi:hypothetical protein
MRFSDLSKSATTTGFLAATGSLTTRHGSNGKTGAFSTKARRPDCDRSNGEVRKRTDCRSGGQQTVGEAPDDGNPLAALSSHTDR